VYFGERAAASYDDLWDRWFQPEAIDPVVSLLAVLAGSGRALELAIGTGRIGLPLSQRGVPVHGIELSRAMAARLGAKPGGDAIPVTIGDMATTRVDGAFTVAYLVFNTINNLTTQEAQVACFPQCRQTSRPWWLLRHRDRNSAPALPAARAGHPGLPGRPQPDHQLHLRPRHPAVQRPLRRVHQRNGGVPDDPGPLRVALRTRPDGTARRTPAT
jgi:hypothetical protein